jgi:hypothetical protein
VIFASSLYEEPTLSILSRKSLWLLAVMAGGTLFQTSCNVILAETISGLAISVVNEYIRALVSQLLGVSTGISL